MDELNHHGDVSPLQDAMAYVNIAWDIVQRDTEAGTLDDLDLDNLEERIGIAEGVIIEQLEALSPRTHRDPLETLTAAEIQEAYYRLPFAEADIHDLPWDEAIARLRSVAQTGTLGACAAYFHVTRRRLRDFPVADDRVKHGVDDALKAIRERIGVSLADQTYHEAREAYRVVKAMRQQLDETRRRRMEV